MDYKGLGVKIGLEFHQELSTKKLFCRCLTDMREVNQITEVRRKLRSVAGETGDVDIAAQYEHMRDRAFIYHGYEGEACLVDTDSEPPHEVCKEALELAFGVAKMFSLTVPDVLCVMRKTVADGSAVSSFQRTMIIGLGSKDSYIATEKGKVQITLLNLEEDACKIEVRGDKKRIYSLSRQGIPLLEIGTDASIKDPQHAKEVAKTIGMMLRSFNKVKRGLGTIRQDVNISIQGGARIEVKGWQDLKSLPDLVEHEIQRQVRLLEIKKELMKRKVIQIPKDIEEVTSLFKGTRSKLIKQILDQRGRVYALLLPGFAGLLKKELCLGRTLGKELTDHAVAHGTNGMIHTDEDLSRYKLEAEFNILRRDMNATNKDTIVIVSQEKGIARKAIEAVWARAKYCLQGVPEETRIPNHYNATTSYARPLPGAHRLYPETDIPTIIVSEKALAKIEVPEPLPKKIKRLAEEYQLEISMVKELLRAGYDMGQITKKYPNISPNFIAHTLITTPKEIRKRYNLEVDGDKHIWDIFKNLDQGKITRDAVLEILLELSRGKKVDYKRYEVMSEKELECVIKKVIDKKKDVPLNAVIGQVMGKLRGNAEGKRIVELVKKLYREL